MNVLGIMSGTSIDSVDYALCSVSDQHVQLQKLWTANFPKTLRAQLHRAARGDTPSWEFCQLHHDLGRFYATNARKGAKHKIDLAGLHGQTVFHNPDRKRPATFQLGEPAYLVEKLRVPVVNNFRAADLAAGGQGAPLATIFHRFVFAERGKHVCVNNLGGISNVTSIDWRRGAQPKIVAFDTGPANMLIDFAIRHFTNGTKHFDEDGVWANNGTASEKLLKGWLRDPYFRRKPPKSTGRELFGEPFFKTAIREMKGLSKFDIAATFTEFTARSISLNYRLHLPAPPNKIILTGGGAANPTLVRAIGNQFAATVLTSEKLGWPVEAIEPAAFALLAFLRMKQRSGNLPETTGANRALRCGQISAP